MRRERERFLAYQWNLHMAYTNSILFFRSSVLYIFRVHRHVRDARIHRTYRPRNPIREMQCRNSLPSSGASSARACSHLTRAHEDPSVRANEAPKSRLYGPQTCAQSIQYPRWVRPHAPCAWTCDRPAPCRLSRRKSGALSCRDTRTCYMESLIERAI